MLKPGGRYRSQACDTEVVVVRAPSEDVELLCGGHPMVDLASDASARLPLASERCAGNLIGKRYTDATGALEVLVTRAGRGTLATGDDCLRVKEAKPLPSSD